MMSFHLLGELARAFRTALVFAFILMSSLAISVMFFIERANAQNSTGPQIFDVRRSLPLEPDEEVTKDFYINAGPESGLKKGVYVSVVRALPIHNPIQNKQQAELNVPVGKLKIIDVQRGITVARLETELSDDERPTLEFEGVMVGDHIDLGTMTTEAPKKLKSRAKKPIAQADSQSLSSPSTTSEGEAGAGSAEAMAARSAAPAPASVTPATAQPAEAPKKTEEPKSADRDEMNLEHPIKKGFPARPATDTVRVADYTDAGPF